MDSRLINLNKQVNSSTTFRPIRAIGGAESTITHQGLLYKLHVFTTVGSDTLNVLDCGSDGLLEVLVVAGGGGGGMDMGGGGGGGGVIHTRYTVRPGELVSVTVGAGGQGGPQGNGGYRTDGTGPQPGSHQFTISATNGGNSVFGNLTAIGGGYGGSSYFDYTPNLGIGASGGSGGGTSGYSNGSVKAGQAGTAGQGYRGGQGGGQYYSGGGGGAAGIGTDSTAQPNGGPGRLVSILGIDLYWGGGGGGSSYTLGTGGNGGIGGGGGGALGTTTGGAGYNNGQAGYGGSPTSQTNTRGGAAGANTGGGGGGGSHYNATNLGGEGGSGIVVVRYPLERPLFTQSPIVSSNLIMNIDIGSPYSYPGNGNFIYDLTGNGLDGTSVNSPTYSSNNLGYFDFNGSNQYIDCGNSSSFSITTAGTISAWFKKPLGSGYKGVVDKGRDGYGAWSLCVDETANRATFKARISGTNRSVVAASDYGNNTWTHIAGVYNGTTLQIYQNGVLSNSASFAGSIGTNSVSVRVGAANDGLFFSGSISQACVYNRALTSTEILENFNASRSRYGI